MTEKSRAAFEATIKRTHPCFSVKRMPEGEYQSGTTENLWLMWQESRRKAFEAAEQTCKETAEACVSVKRFNLLTDAGKEVYTAMSKGALSCESAIRGLI